MNLLAVSLILVLSVIAVFRVTAKGTTFTFQKVGPVGKKQVATVEFDLEEKDFTDEKYGNLHRDILIALNRRKTTTAKNESQTTQRATEPTAKTTVTTATTVEERTSTAGSTAKEELASTATTEPTTKTTVTTATTVDETTLSAGTTSIEENPSTATAQQTATAEPETPIEYPPFERKRRSLSDEIVYEDKDVFFFDLENKKITNGIIRVPVGLHKEGYRIPENQLYDVLIDMNNKGELGRSAGLRVVKIYLGFPSEASWFYIPIVLTLGVMLLILLLGTLYFVIFRSNARYVAQTYYRQEQGSSSDMNGTTKTTVGRRPQPLSTPNGHLKSNRVHPVMLDDNYEGWLIPMSEFYAEHSITREYV